MDLERAKTLLYNAISLLADKTLADDEMFVDWMWDVCNKMGTTPSELEEYGVDFDEMF